jgi:hypothetical protein
VTKVCRFGRNGYHGDDVIKALATTALVLAATVAAAAAEAGPAKTQFVRFQTPSRNIGCVYSAAQDRRPVYLRCDILSGLRPAPKGSCRLDWTGFTMVARKPPRPTCAGDTVYDRSARILRYGSAWSQGGFTCRSRRSGLRCTNAAGRGFFLSRARSYRF